MKKKQSAVSGQQSAVGTTRRVVRPAVRVVGTTRRVIRPRTITLEEVKERLAQRVIALGGMVCRPPGPQTRDQHLSALSVKIDATHKALVTVANDIVNLKRKLRRQEEIYRTLAHNYGSRTAEYTRQIVEASANSAPDCSREASSRQERTGPRESLAATRKGKS